MAELDYSPEPDKPDVSADKIASGQLDGLNPPELSSDFRELFSLPEQLFELPIWLREPLSQFLRLKQRNWSARTLQRSTRQLFNRLYFMTKFFISRYNWSSWEQVSIHWIDNYIENRLHAGIAQTTINWDLSNFRVLCQFLIDEGISPPQSIFRVKFLKGPRRLPRPLSDDQVRRLEHQIQSAIIAAETESRRVLACRDLACFYILWHCGLRISEVCSLLVSDLDFEGRRLFVCDSKNRKDRMVYLSDTAIGAIQKYVAASINPHSNYLFTTRCGAMRPRTLQRRLRIYGQGCSVDVTARRLRHTFASQMLAAGVPVTSIQRYLGHKSLDTTMIYTGISDPLLQQDYYRGIGAIDSAFASPPPAQAARVKSGFE